MVDEARRRETPLVQSVAKAIALMHCFVDADEGLTLSDLARRTGLSPSTTLRLLRTLCAGGLLSRAEGSELYVRGPVILALAQRAFVASDFSDALRVLDFLVDETGESAALGAPDGDCVVVLLRANARTPLRVERPVGTRAPLHVSAMGKVLLAFGAEPPEEAVARLGELVPMTSATITGRRALVADLEATRERGYALVDEEHYIGVRSVGVPVGAPGDAVRAAIEVLGPGARLTTERISDVVTALRRTADVLSHLPMYSRLEETASWLRRSPSVA